jgi:hypothetical protein
MDALTRIHQVRRTCCEMLQDRGYLVPEVSDAVAPGSVLGGPWQHWKGWQQVMPAMRAAATTAVHSSAAGGSGGGGGMTAAAKAAAQQQQQ